MTEVAQRPRLVARETLEGLIDRAWAILREREALREDAVNNPEADLDTGLGVDEERAPAAVRLTAVIAVAAAWDGDVELALPLLELAEALPRLYLMREPAAAIADSLASLAAEERLTDEAFERLRRSGFVRLKLALARRLGLDQGRQRALLEALAVDGTRQVRNAAIERLRERQDLAWWVGLFPADPLPELATELAPVVAEIAELARGSLRTLWSSDQRLAELARALPDEVVRGLCRRLLDEGDTAYRLHAFAAEVLSRPGGLEAVLAAFSAHDTPGALLSMTLPGALSRVPRQARLAACQEGLGLLVRGCPLEDGPERKQRARKALFTMLRYGMDRPDDERERDVFPDVATAVGGAWPPDADVGPLLDALEAMASDVARELLKALTRSEPEVLPWQRLMAVREQGYPAPWCDLQTTWREVIARAPREYLGPLLARVVGDGTTEEKAWAAEMLFNQGGAVGLKDWLAEDALRPAIVASTEVRRALLPALRERLLAGGLTFDEAAELLGDVGRRGVATDALAKHPYQLYMIGQRGDEWRRRRSDSAAEKEVAAPPPVTEEEWRTYRALRDSVTERSKAFWSRALVVLPVGPLDASDRALALDAEARFEDGDEAVDPAELAGVWGSRTAPEELAEATARLKRLVALVRGRHAQVVRSVARGFERVTGCKVLPSRSGEEDADEG